MAAEELLQQADAARERGNARFKADEYQQANESYAEALSLLESAQRADASCEAKAREAANKCRLNRAACLLKLQGFAAAAGEARAVLEHEPENAKALFRLGQACSRLGDLSTAQQALVDSIKRNPSLREPRQELEKLRARLQANPRLEQALQDMTLVEERALRALNSADLKRGRGQLELLLKDARATGEAHWEARALLGLALLCQDEGEATAAMDYIDAARRLLTANDDRRAELFCLQTTALVYMDSGKLASAQELLEGGLMLAREMGETGIAARFTVNLALVHTLSASASASPVQLGRAVEYGLEAVEMAKARGDRNFGGIACVTLAQALRLSGRPQPAAQYLAPALDTAEALGYSHVLAAALRQFAFMQLDGLAQPAANAAASSAATPAVDTGVGAPPGSAVHASVVRSALDKLRRSHAIAKANGLKRAECDDACNLYRASVRFAAAELSEAIDGLEAALGTALSSDYGEGELEIRLALAAAHRRECSVGPCSSLSAGDVAALDAAQSQLRGARAKVVEEGSEAHRRLLSEKALCHALHALPDPASDVAATGSSSGEAVEALRAAEQACELERRHASPSATGLTNLAVAMMLARRAGSSEPVDRSAAVSAAISQLEVAVGLAREDAEIRHKARLAMICAYELVGDVAHALMSAAALVEEMTSMGASAASRSARACIEQAEGLSGRGETLRALEAYKDALRLMMAS